MVVSDRKSATILLAESEAARILRVHPEAVRVWCSEGVLTPCSYSRADRPMVTMDSVLALISPIPVEIGVGNERAEASVRLEWEQLNSKQGAIVDYRV